ANKLMKGYIGSGNIDTNSRLCMSSAVAGYVRAFGEDVVPVEYADLDDAELVILAGSNLAWCHPVLYQRLVAAKRRRPEMRVVNIDPRRTATSDIADLHLPIAPGADVTLFNGLLQYLWRADCLDAPFVAGHTSGLGDALEASVECTDIAVVARRCGLQQSAVRTFFAWVAECPRTITLFSQGVNQSSQGTDKVNAIINCHLLTGRLAKKGAGPFSITGQPNAMGGREVGGLANQLAAHLRLDDSGQRRLLQRFWGSPSMVQKPGLKAVDLFEAVHNGQVKAIWIMATNPVVSLPNADRVRAALDACDLVVVSEVDGGTDTAAYADVLLPAAAWGEREGTVTNSERVISRQRAFRSPPGEARPDWWALCELGKRLGYAEAFDYQEPADIFDEHARLSALENPVLGPSDEDREGGRYPRYFHLGGLTGLSRAEYDALEPVRWPIRTRERPAPERPFANGYFSHPDGRARFVAVQQRGPEHAPDARFPLVLNTGRVRDQWHTMTRTGFSATLAQHRDEPTVDLHPEDALTNGIRPGELARVSTRWGTMVVRAVTSGDMKRGELFIPIHWNGQTASDARVGALVNPVVDPLSGEPEFKHTPAAIAPFESAWTGFLFTRRPAALDGVTWWVRIQAPDCLRYELAGLQWPDDMEAFAQTLTELPGTADWIVYADRAAGSYRAICFDADDRVLACLFLSQSGALPARDWLTGQMAHRHCGAARRARLLAGEAPHAVDCGPTVCSCFGVGRAAISQAIQEEGLRTAEAVTAHLKAGGNCGSCLPEIRALIDDLATPAAQ
ncbi:MAG: molybdopterin-dependent oxidoreductase, partial [Algiphilus sp.]